MALFNEVGYPNTGLGDIIARAGVTKGAFYYHFESKQAVAETVMEESMRSLRAEVAGPTQANAPALEILLHGVFVAAELFRANPLNRAGFHLSHALGGFSPAAGQTYSGWLESAARHVRTAIDEGDIAAGVDPATLAEALVGASIGSQIVTAARAEGADMLIDRLERVLRLVLSAVTTADSRSYFEQYLSREALRHRSAAV